MVIMGDVKGHLTDADVKEHVRNDVHIELETPYEGHHMVYITCDDYSDGVLILEALRRKGGHYRND
jgi:hypothetical protein